MFDFIKKLFKKKTLSKISFLNSLEKSFLNGEKVFVSIISKPDIYAFDEFESDVKSSLKNYCRFNECSSNPIRKKEDYCTKEYGCYASGFKYEFLDRNIEIMYKETIMDVRLIINFHCNSSDITDYTFNRLYEIYVEFHKYFEEIYPQIMKEREIKEEEKKKQIKSYFEKLRERL